MIYDMSQMTLYKTLTDKGMRVHIKNWLNDIHVTVPGHKRCLKSVTGMPFCCLTSHDVVEILNGVP